MVLDATGDGLPRVVHWGADLGAGVNLAGVIAATTPPVPMAVLTA